MKKAIIYIHGKGGRSLEINQYKESCLGFDMVGIDYNEYLPWIVEKQIKSVYEKAEKTYDEIYILANSIGAYFAMTLYKITILRKLSLYLPFLIWSNLF